MVVIPIRTGKDLKQLIHDVQRVTGEGKKEKRL